MLLTQRAVMHRCQEVHCPGAAVKSTYVFIPSSDLLANNFTSGLDVKKTARLSF